MGSIRIGCFFDQRIDQKKGGSGVSARLELCCRFLLSAFVVCCLFPASDGFSKPSHGQALQAPLKYSKTSSHWEYADPNAQKGGVLRLGTYFSFDKLNPYSLKGVSANGVNLVFETLMDSSNDEAFAQYGLIAKTVDISADELSVTFEIRKEAQFSDGHPITAEDVEFSFNKLMSDEAHPFYKGYYSDVKSCVVLDKLRVRFDFKQKNPELHMIIGQLAVLPKHFYEKGNFSKDFTDKILGSGPYLLESFQPGKMVTWKKNPNYWGKNLWINRGRYNYDRLVWKFFRNPNIMFEGFKAGEFDFQGVNSSKQWAVDVKGNRWDKNWLIKDKWYHNNSQGMQGYVLNLRNPLFQSRTVRKALAIAFDFQWSNQALFYNQYTQSQSYWNNSELSAQGLPSSLELKYLKSIKDKVPSEVFTQELSPLGEGLSGRQRLIAAKKMLDKDGWKLKDGVLTKGVQKFEFDVLMFDQTWEKITEPYLKNLRKLGIFGRMNVKDHSIFQKQVKGFNFDVIVRSFRQSQSPGNEQFNFWHSSRADHEGSENLIGIKNPAVDFLVERLVMASSRVELIALTRALDRVLWYNYYVVPHWYIPYHRVTYWNQFGLPKTKPKYYSSDSYFIEFSWFDSEKKKLLELARKNGKSLKE